MRASSRLMSLVLSIVLVVGLAPLPAWATGGLSAGETSDRGSLGAGSACLDAQARKSVSIKMKKIRKTGRYRYAQCKYAFDLPVVKGRSKVAKRINKSLRTRYKATLANKRRLFESAKNTNPSSYYGKFFFTTSAKTTYNKRGYVSFKYKERWFAGGVFNGQYSGDTYSLKTGKRLKISNVVSGSDYRVKQKVAERYIKKYSNGSWNSTAYNEIVNMKISDFKFYLKNGKVVVCFAPYPPGVGNAPFRTVTIKGKY